MSGARTERQSVLAAVAFGLGLQASAPAQAQVTPTGASKSWLATVSETIRAGEYHLSPADGGGWTAPNRAQDLRATWRHGDLVVRPRVEAAAWTFTYRLASVARGESARELEGPPRERVSEGRLEWERAGVVEWYANDARGIEQGFLLDVRPPGDAGESVVVDGLISGLLAYPAEDGQSILLRTAAGVDAIRIRDLVVRDADGVELEACLAVTAGKLSISFDDRGARYPVTVDPLMTSPAWSAEIDQADAHFGHSVATAGDVNGDGYSDVVVGALDYDGGQRDEGRAFAYLGSAAGLGTAPAWTAGCDQEAALFGISVATAGDVNGDGYSDVIVGADRFENGQFTEGGVFVYHGSATGLEATPAWTAESDSDFAYFGGSVAAAGDVNGDGFSDVIVGAPLLYVAPGDYGGAFAYYGSASGLSATPSWMVRGDQGRLGWSVATAGDVNGDGYSDVIVGVPFHAAGNIEEGRALMYLGSATGLRDTPDWTADGGQAGARFGVAVATAGDVNGDGYSDVLVGAYAYDNGQVDEGRAFAFHGSATGLASAPAWVAEGDQANAGFGLAVATAGDVNGDGYADVLVGAPYHENGQAFEGSVLAYLGSAAGLSSTPAWTKEGDQDSATLGITVATAGDVNGDGYSDVIVGAEYYDSGQTDEGCAFLYNGSASGLAATAGWTAVGDQADEFFGASAATAGDVNGDGYSDVIVGAPRYDGGQVLEGRALVYHGSSSGLATTPAWSAEGEQTFAAFGSSVATAGDVNGDGYSDVIVGARTYDNPTPDEGRAFAYYGSAGGLDAMPAWTAESDQWDAYFGCAVASAGDVNGDGYSDVIVGASSYDAGPAGLGAAFAYHGSASGLDPVPAWMATSVSANLGNSVAGAGDVNGDGYSDVILGDPFYTDGQIGEGGAFAFHGSAAGLAATPAWTVESDLPDAMLGVSVSTAGDVNGDGYSDVIVGALTYDNGQVNEGAALAYLGSATGLGTTPAWTAEGEQQEARLGASVSTAGDVNGDGYSDVLVGAPSYTNGQTDEGRAFTYLGSAAGLGASAAWTAEGNQVDAGFGGAVGTAGDVNGDGYSDVIVGAGGLGLQPDAGAAFVYYGNEGDGLDRIARQARASLAAPIDILGGVRVGYGFRVRANGRSPFGRDRVRLEAEVEPLGTPFDGAGIVSTPYTDTGVPTTSGSVVDLSVLAGTPLGGPLHWRARLRGMFPFPWQSHWMSPPSNCVTETDLRMSPVACDAGAAPLPACVGGSVTLDGSGSSGPAPPDYLWSTLAPEVLIASPSSARTDVTVTAAGTFAVQLTVTSGLMSAICSVDVTAGDFLPPTISCPATLVVATTYPGVASVDLIATVTDDCDPAVVTWNDRTPFGLDASGVYPCGDTVVTFTALDASGNTSSCTTIVTVADTVVLGEVSASGATVPLRVARNRARRDIRVTFESLGPGDAFNLYAGTLGPTGIVAYDHASIACKAAGTIVAPGVAELVAPLDPGRSHYYLVSASNCLGEGPRGYRSDGIEHPDLPTDCGGLP